MKDPTLETAALREAREHGWTCHSCVNWEKVAGVEGCRLDRREWPGLCVKFDLVTGIKPNGERV